jgi:hypothetical protein
VLTSQYQGPRNRVMILGFICKITSKIFCEFEANLKNTPRYKSAAWPEGGGGGGVDGKKSSGG